ncbi:MAG: ammonia-forming cytochrome c nitrite reductase subunit c552 [Candidatus Loosdrechtia sp.]|uniref:ammonia-forming cytochrome c nitrite reductase subunit c552 n=1 Tax=Candidatus Loosdrechtia sp. TaxID=3101272 RepID=UPI003A79F49B|nr:MAG: ammonia-forming cytochrome c nitrite reductase subunit c552 [Candidatus Jettenia sp. AMX2]
MENGNQRNRKVIYLLLVAVVTTATVGVVLLLENISRRKREAQERVFRVVEITEYTIDPAIWGKNFPRQYDGYLRTVDIERTRHGGSEAFDKLEETPVWRTIFKGYAFSVDYREERGHAYMLSDQDITERIKIVQQPGACLHCHSSVLPAYLEAAKNAGMTEDDARRQEQIMKGFEIVCAMPYQEARRMVSHPVSCVDCHDPETIQIRVTRPGFLNAIQALAKSDYPLPHLPSIERWRKNGRKGEYDVNTMATRQEMRSFACGQCHVEYYFQGEGKLLVYPWQKGLGMEEIENYYNETSFRDWIHEDTGAPVLKAQHPEFEMWSQGIHARSGVACADCHMPYKREGAIKISDHHVRSPLLNIANACQTCHHYSEKELKERAETIQNRTKALMNRAEEAVIGLILDLQKAREFGIPDGQLKTAQDLHRKAQWRLDFVAAENSMGFHAPQEAARILGEAIDYARQGQIEVTKLPVTAQ